MNKLRADIFKKWCRTIPTPSVFIFDLDLTIWDCTIEEDDFVNNNNIQKYVPSERHYMLTHLQDLGHELNIGSRSTEPIECKKHLKKLFPNIKFNNMQIYPTPAFKRKHVDAIFKDREVENFYFFDDELHILKDLEKGHLRLPRQDAPGSGLPESPELTMPKSCIGFLRGSLGQASGQAGD